MIHGHAAVCTKRPLGDSRGAWRTFLVMMLVAVGVFAITHAERTSSVDGDAVRLIVDDLELVDLEPNELESVVECLLLQILRAVLASVRLPLTALRAGAFQLTPTAGPDVEDDRVEMFGAV